MKFFLLSYILCAALFLCGKEPQDSLREKALNGDLYAMVALGDEFAKGENRPRNPALAAFWYRKAAVQKLPLGLYRYGVALEFGWGVPKDPRLAFEQYLAAGKYAAAQLRIAEMLIAGVPGNKKLAPVPKDAVKAVTIMRSLCKANYYPALLKLANVLYSVPAWRQKHGKEIYSLVLKSTNADPVPPEAFLFQAKLLQEGIGVKKDEIFARALLEVAAGQGSAEAAFLFAQCLEKGIGTPVNEKKAFEFFSKAAEKEYPPALVRMGDYRLEGKFLALDPAEAFAFFAKGAEKNFPAALRKMGWCYENGIGTDKDLKKAYSFYERSAYLGDPQGMYHCGRCFLEGIGVKADPAGANYFFRRGAAAGNKESMLQLAESLRTGRGCSVDMAQAQKVLEQAAKL